MKKAKDEMRRAYKRSDFSKLERCGFNRSLQHRMEFICRGLESQGLAWALVQS